VICVDMIGAQGFAGNIVAIIQRLRGRNANKIMRSPSTISIQFAYAVRLSAVTVLALAELAQAFVASPRTTHALQPPRTYERKSLP
jgi:hypothetical protein